MTKLSNPVPIFLDTRGALMDGGHVYVGVANADPQTDPIDVFWDVDLTIPATQPLRTIGGRIVNGVPPASVFFAEADFSMRTTDVNGVLCDYSATVFTSASEFQPLDTDLTAIAALATTSFGRNLLTMANSAALKAETGIPDCLPISGGTMTGNILRSSAGIHPYWSDPAMTGGRIFITAAGASDPTSLPGDIWFTY